MIVGVGREPVVRPGAVVCGGARRVSLGTMPTLSSPPPTTPARRAAVGLLAGLLGLIAFGWAAAFLARSLTSGLAATGWDADLSDYLVRNRRPWLTTASRAASWLADLEVVVVLVLTLGVAARARVRTWRVLWVLSLAGGGALIISAVVKVIIARARPPLSSAMVEAYGLAFPSGHALRAMAVYGALAWLLTAATRTRAVQALTWVCAGAIIAAVGFARIYLGAHWLSDVLASYVMGAAWLGLVLFFTAAGSFKRCQQPRRLFREGTTEGT